MADAQQEAHLEGLAGIQGLETRIPLADTARWQAQLRDHGFVVLAGCLGDEEVTQARELVWAWLEGLGSGINRSDMSTWQNQNWPGAANLGFLQTHGGGHSDAAWYIRSRPGVKRAFSTIWETEDLLTSFDTFIAWRPWTSHAAWQPHVERLHIDQNPVSKPGFHCVQGMVPLLPVTADAGGLQVVPGSHTDDQQAALKKRIPFVKMGGDWCELSKKDPLIGNGTLLLAEPGDLILWDSRLVHGGHVGPGVTEDAENPVLARLALTVCMTPRGKATENVLELRRRAVEHGQTLTHWPHEFNQNCMSDSSGQNIRSTYTPPQLTPEMQALV